MVRCYVYPLQYNKTIDECIIELLLVNEHISQRDLKRQVELSLSTSDPAPSLKKSKKKKLPLTISFEVFNFHLKRLQSDDVLLRSREGMYVFYYLSEKYKKERLFNILGVRTDQIKMRAIYTILFYIEACHRWAYDSLHGIQWLTNFLEEKKARLQDMEEIYSNRNSIENKREYKSLTYIEIITDYKLKKTGEIIFKIEYQETERNYRNTYRVLYMVEYQGGVDEYSLMRDKMIMEYLLSINMNIHKWKAKELLQSLVESRLVQRSSQYGTDYFMIVDHRLRYLIHDFLLLRTLKFELERPDSPTAWILSRREKTNIFKTEKPSGDIKLKEEYKDMFSQERERQFNNIVKNIKEKHADTLKQYVFLHDTIRELYPEILK